LFGTTYTIAPGSNRMTGIGSLGIGYAIDTAGKRTADSASSCLGNVCGRVNRARSETQVAKRTRGSFPIEPGGRFRKSSRTATGRTRTSQEVKG